MDQYPNHDQSFLSAGSVVVSVLFAHGFEVSNARLVHFLPREIDIPMFRWDLEGLGEEERGIG